MLTIQVYCVIANVFAGKNIRQTVIMNKHCRQLYKAGITFLWGALCFSGSLLAQQVTGLEGSLNYPLDRSFVLYDFGNNIAEIENLHTYITKTLGDPSLSVRSIGIVGYSSPEGDYHHNEILARERAENLKNYLHPFFPDINIQVDCVPEDWHGLINVLTRASYPEMEIVRTIALSDQSPVQKEAQLKKLPQRIYKELSRNYFPLLRRASLTIYCDKTVETEPDEDLSKVVTMSQKQDEQQVYLHAQHNNQQYRNVRFYQQNIQKTTLNDRYGYTYYNKAKKKKTMHIYWGEDFTPVVAIGTNLLQWAGFRPDFTHTTFIPNISLEYYFLKQWSIKGVFAYCNWSYNDDECFQGISSYSLEPRFWLSNNTFHGFFLGIYGQFGDYNNRKSGNCHTGRYHSEGISVGYLLPLYRGLAVELSVRGGHRYSTVKRYNAGEECNNLCGRYTKREYTVTGSNISLIYRF